jgi:hypothetical protein
VKVVAASTVAVAILVLVASAATAGAAQRAPHQLRALAPHFGHTSRLSPATQTAKTAGINCVSACSAYESTINKYFTDVAAASVAGATDNVYSVATQYSNIQYSETFDASTNTYVDGNPFPTTKTCHDLWDKYCVTDGQLQAEIGKVIKAHHWPTHSKTALYFIFTPAHVGVCQFRGFPSRANPCTTNAFCAYHAATLHRSFIYAVEPDAATAIGGACTPTDSLNQPQAPAGNSADPTINTISHEQIEAITDPFGESWISLDLTPGQPPEIGDLCAYDFGTPLGGAPGALYNQVINGNPYYLQLEYSNAANSGAGGCVPYLNGPVTPADVRNGSGPLVYLGGDVMTTNTVYAIYWMPAKPANIKLPTASGTTKVGKTLKAWHGEWSHLPKFAYRWLRCSAAGTSCTGITKATDASYTLVKADAHHSIEVRVTAKNMAGRVSAISVPTAAVTRR